MLSEKSLKKTVPPFIYINSVLSEYEPLEIRNEGLSSQSMLHSEISLHRLFMS